LVPVPLDQESPGSSPGGATESATRSKPGVALSLLAQGLALERNLFLKLCITEPALARMRFYEEKKIPSPSRSFEV